jgi:hypothetical protein
MDIYLFNMVMLFGLIFRGNEMKFNRESWIFVTGQAGSGKTYWIKEHIKHMPKGSCCIYDFNRNDYQEFSIKQNYWQVQTGSQTETEDFMNLVYAHGNTFCVFDEADNYFLYPSEEIRKFVNTARNRGIGAMVNAKRAKAIQPVYRNRFTHLILFRVSMPEDIRYLEQWVGCEKGRLDILRNLGVGQHIEVDLMKNTIETKGAI